MDKLQKLVGFSGRSEVIRAGVRNLLYEERTRQELTGLLHALLLAIHDEESDEEMTELRHVYDKLVNIHIHSKIDKNRCLEIFLLKGSAAEIKDMTKKFQSKKKINNVKLIVM
jgi:CopG family transcriptional regulator, nickel-responsive regulator